MSVFTALFSGVNGINSNGEAVSVIGDNIANVNTSGYKSSRPEFEDIMAGTSSVSGLGSTMKDTTTVFSQGGFESTSVTTDMAIDGSGFFVVRDIAANNTYYSRSGQFYLDKDGYLINHQNQRLQGFDADDNGNIGTTPEDLQFTFEPVSPNQTSSVTIKANLDANETTPAAWDNTNPVTTSNFAVGITVYDSIGNDHLVTVYYRKSTTANVWTWHAVMDSADADTAITSTGIEAANGTLIFDNDGKLTSKTQSVSDFDFAGATLNQAITFDFGSTTGTGTGLDGVTQFGSDSSLNDLSQNGYASGNLTTIDITSSGIITGNYTNGTTQSLGQVTLALFNNEQGLKRIGGNAFEATIDSGAALIDGAENGGRGTILSQTLEQSNVDLANELIKMVIIQRGFQANSRTISVVNELLGSLVSLGN